MCVLAAKNCCVLFELPTLCLDIVHMHFKVVWIKYAGKAELQSTQKIVHTTKQAKKPSPLCALSHLQSPFSIL